MQVNVEVIANKLTGEVSEREQTSCETLLEYALQQDPELHARPGPLFSAQLNGDLVPFDEWRTAYLYPGDTLRCTIEPQGLDPVTLGLIALAAASAAYSYYVASNIPDTGSTAAQGSDIYRSDLRQNAAKAGGVIPEIFGSMPRYPEIITAIRRKYISNEEWLYVGLCVGRGEYSIATAGVRIGETPVSNYGSDITFDIVDPGDSVAAIEAAEHWYTSDEIGASAGTSGLELNDADGDTTLAATNRYSFSATEITLTDDSSPPASVAWPVSVGDYIEISNGNDNTANAGRYRIEVLTSGNSVATCTRFVNAGGDTWVIDDSWSAFVTESNKDITVTYKNESGAWSTWFNVLPEGETTATIEIDVRYPRGLGKYKDSGGINGYTVVIEYEYRPVGGSATSGTISNTDNTADEIATTTVLNLGAAIEPQIRFRRQTPYEDNSRFLQDVEVARVKGKLTAASSYDGVTTAFFAIKGTNAISNIAEKQINMDVQRLLPTVASYKGKKDSGAALTYTAHSQIGAAYVYLTLDAGYTLSDIDLDALDALQTTWTTRGDTFNAEVAEESTLFELQRLILAVGYAEPTIDTLMLAKRLDPSSVSYDYLYTPDNIDPPGIVRRGELYDPDEHDGVEVEWFNPSTKQNEVATYTLAAAGDPATPLRPKKLRGFGITDGTRAWRFGSIERRRLHYKPMEFTFTTERDALNSAYLDTPALADDLLIGGITGTVTGTASGDVVQLDADLVFDAGESYRIAFSKPDGTMSGLYTATAGATSSEVIVSPALDFTPVVDGSAEPPLFAFGTVNDWGRRVIVREITPEDDSSVNVVCEEYIAAIWADIDGSPP